MAVKSFNQFAWVSGTTDYKFGHKSVPVVKMIDAPQDSDFTRTAMLYADSTYRFYCFKAGTSDTLYQFGWDGSAYKWGHKSIRELKVTNAPADADASSFAMLNDGSTYRLYLMKSGASALYQFAWDGSTYKFGHNSIREIAIAGFPGDADFSRFDMLHDGTNYRLYALSTSSTSSVYQGAFQQSSNAYTFGFASIPTLNLVDAPTSTGYCDINMLYDGTTYRLYLGVLMSKLSQFGYVSGTREYKYGEKSTPTLEVLGMPADADFYRSAMLHDGSDYRFYCFKAGSNTLLYQAAWNGSAYVWGHKSIKTLEIVHAPTDADFGTFAMLHDGRDYRLYCAKEGATAMYQFAWDGSVYKFGHNSIPELPLIGFPAAADFKRFDMLHDGSAYRVYAMSSAESNKVFQGSFDRAANGYVCGHNSIPELTVVDAPSELSFFDINMLYDGSVYRMYYTTEL